MRWLLKHLGNIRAAKSFPSAALPLTTVRMDDKEVKWPSSLVCFGTLSCLCFKETVVCSRVITMNIRDPKDGSLISLQIAFKHVNFIRIVQQNLKQALVLHVSSYCAKRIRKMFSADPETIHQYFDAESDDWNKRFVIVDFTDCSGGQLELLMQVLSFAATRKASFKQEDMFNSTTSFFNSTPDDRFSSLINCLTLGPHVKASASKLLDSFGNRKQNPDCSLKPTSSNAEKEQFAEKKRSHDVDIEIIAKRVKQNGKELQSSPASSSKKDDDLNANIGQIYSPSKKAVSPQEVLPKRQGISPVKKLSNAVHSVQTSQQQPKLYRQILPKPVPSVSKVATLVPVSSSILTTLSTSRPMIKTISVVSAPSQPRGLLAVGRNASSATAIIGTSPTVPSRPQNVTSVAKTNSTADNRKGQLTRDLTPCKTTSSLDNNSSTSSNYLTSLRKSSVSNGAPRPFTAKSGKEELVKERERLREKQHIVMLQYPRGGDSEAIKISAKDIDALQPGELLNDNIICFYLKYIRNELVSSEKRNSYFFFDTFFYSSLTKGVRSAKDRYKQLAENYEVVQRRTRKVDLFSKDYIVVPICEAQHWYVAIITYPRAAILTKESADVENKLKNSEVSLQRGNPQLLPRGVCKAHIVILDSFVDYNETKCFLVMGSLLKYLECEYNARRRPSASQNEYFDRRRFDMLCPRGIPQQKNVYDCGIYMLKYLEYFLVKPPEFLRRSDTFLRWYPKFSVDNTRENILSHLKQLCSEEKWNAYMEYRKMDEHYTDLIGDRTVISPAPSPEPEPLRRIVSESDLSVEETFPIKKRQKRRNSSTF